MPSDENRRMPADGEPILAFMTEGTWSANDLGRILEGLDKSYLVVMLARFFALETNSTVDRLARASGPDLFLDEAVWRGRLRRLAPNILALEEDVDALIGRCLENPSLFMNSSDELIVESIEMASPGGFNLRGLGEPIRQLRELIKDLWFRNSEEKKRGELTILREKLQLITDYHLTDVQLQKLSEVFLDESAAVRELIQSKQLLLSDGRELEPRPTMKSRSRRRKQSR